MQDYSLSIVFQRYLGSEKPAGSLKKIAELIVSGNFSRSTFDELLEMEGIKDAPQLKEALLDQVLFYASECVRDHEISDEEQENLWMLCTIFRIKEGDFLKSRIRRSDCQSDLRASE